METKIVSGQKVRVPRGTAVRTTHPNPRRPATRRDQTVVVHHVLPAWRKVVAHSYRNADGTWGQVEFEGRTRDQEDLCRDFGLPFATPSELAESLKLLLSKTTAESPYAHDNVRQHWLEMQPARIVWAGSGGYWCEVPASVVESCEASCE